MQKIVLCVCVCVCWQKQAGVDGYLSIQGSLFAPS